MVRTISYEFAHDPSHASPPSMQELSAIAIGIDTWRSKQTKLTGRKSKRYQPYRKRKSVKRSLSKNPRVIDDIIKQYSKVFEESMKSWLRNHFKKVFKLRYHRQNDILNDFSDFVIDHTGAIHDSETAKRMVHCDRLSADVRFVIACLYSFEDDIKRIRPSISGERDFSKIDNYVQLLVKVWIMRLSVNDLEDTMTRINDHIRTVRQTIDTTTSNLLDMLNH